LTIVLRVIDPNVFLWSTDRSVEDDEVKRGRTTAR